MLTAPIDQDDLNERFGDLLESQREFIFAPERFACIDGGFASGKTHAGCLRGLILSAAVPGNVGMILRYRGTDLEESTMKTFFEVCPPSWIRSYNKKARTAVLRNNSVIMFRHLHDASSSAKTRRLGANLGWFFIDQMEECEEAHFNAMISRLRLPRAPKKFGFGAANPNGHDWIWEKFFPTFKPWPRDAKKQVVKLPNGKFYQALRRGDLLGIAVNSEENRISNGGFVEDRYYDSLRETYSQEMLDRYMYCSFDDFHGKLYKEFEAGMKDPEFSSVHNIDPFPIPRNWQLVVGIDPGGDSPWAVIPNYIDEEGNLIVVPGFHQRTARVPDPVRWIKNHLPWNESRTTYVIDWENKVVMVEMADNGIQCQTANKAVQAGILRVAGMMHVRPNRRLPSWYKATQPTSRYLKFKDKGCPTIFVFNNAYEWRAEHDKAKWDPNKPDVMWKNSIERFDSVDAERYVCMSRPEASLAAFDEFDYTEMEKADPLTAKVWKDRDRRLSERNNRMRGGAALREADMEREPQNEFGDLGKQYKWTEKGEF